MRKPYPSDLTDEQWAVIEPLIPVSSVGRPRKVEMREVLNAIFYLNGFVPIRPEQSCASTSRTAEGYNLSKTGLFRGSPMSKQSVKPSVVGPW